MRFPVHQKQNKKRFETLKKSDKILLLITVIPLILIFLGIIIMLVWVGEFVSGIALAGIVSLLAAVTVHISALPLQSGYLKLDHQITFHNPVGRYRHRKYEYNELDWLFVSHCPVHFTQRKGRHSFYTPEEWTAMYGTYVVALDSQRNALFACRFQEEAWEFLKTKCQNTRTHIMTEAEYISYQKEQHRVEEETCRKHGYEKEISKYNGYIN